MVLYRIHSAVRSSCDIVYGENTISTLDSISQKGINKLLERGTITEVSLPPLFFLVVDRSLIEKLSKVGIEDAAQLLCADLGEVSEKLNMSETILQEVVRQIGEYLNPRRSG